MGRRRIESRFVLPAFSPAPGHFVVDLQNCVLRPVTAVLLLVLTLHNWERLHDVVNVVTIYAIEVEVEGVEFGSEPEAAVLVPKKGGMTEIKILCHCLDTPRGVEELDSSANCKSNVRVGVSVRGQEGELLHIAEGHIGTPQLLPDHVVKDESRCVRAQQDRCLFNRRKNEWGAMPNGQYRKDGEDRGTLVSTARNVSEA